jgi:periplasmic copper chaperone A
MKGTVCVSRSGTTIAVLVAACFMTLLGAGSAAAHVTVNPPTAVAGSETQLTFRAPNEQAHARFTKLVVHLPAAAPLASLDTRPIPGWVVSTTTGKLAKPITTDNGTTTEYTNTVTWIATGGGVAPGQYENFDVSAGPLPGRGTMVFTADQTYSDGTVVHWNEPTKPGAAEPDHPAPVLTLIAAAAKTPDTSDDAARGLGIAGLAVGAVGLATGGMALRRRSSRT